MATYLTSTFYARGAALENGSRDLNVRIVAALAALHEDDRDTAEMMACENASDSTRCAPRTFAWRKMMVCTLEMIVDVAPEYGLRRA